MDQILQQKMFKKRNPVVIVFTLYLTFANYSIWISCKGTKNKSKIMIPNLVPLKCFEFWKTFFLKRHLLMVSVLHHAHWQNVDFSFCPFLNFVSFCLDLIFNPTFIFRVAAQKLTIVLLLVNWGTFMIESDRMGELNECEERIFQNLFFTTIA